MFTQSLRLGRILGIPVGVNYSWFIVFVLITFSLVTQFARLHPDLSPAVQVLLGIGTSLLFFLSILLHEMGHSVVALRYGIPVASITLFIFGGIAQISREPERPMHEFTIAIAGPVVSALLGALFLIVSTLLSAGSSGIATTARWLGEINIAVALFNLIPGFPLDGGRILRSILWHFTGSYERATVLSSGAGQVFAYLFIFLGIWQAFTGNFFGGLWIGFIGWFLLNAAQSATTLLDFRKALSGVSARDIMTEECIRLPGTTSVAELVENHFLRTGKHCSMIVDDGDHFRGLVTLHEIKRIPREEWPTTQLQQAMVPEERLIEVEPDTPADRVVQLINERNVQQIPVVENGKLLGIIGRSRILSFLQTRLALKA